MRLASVSVVQPSTVSLAAEPYKNSRELSLPRLSLPPSSSSISPLTLPPLISSAHFPFPCPRPRPAPPPSSPSASSTFHLTLSPYFSSFHLPIPYPSPSPHIAPSLLPFLSLSCFLFLFHLISHSLILLLTRPSHLSSIFLSIASPRSALPPPFPFLHFLSFPHTAPSGFAEQTRLSHLLVVFIALTRSCS